MCFGSDGGGGGRRRTFSDHIFELGSRVDDGLQARAKAGLVAPHVLNDVLDGPSRGEPSDLDLVAVAVPPGFELIELDRAVAVSIQGFHSLYDLRIRHRLAAKVDSDLLQLHVPVDAKTEMLSQLYAQVTLTIVRVAGCVGPPHLVLVNCSRTDICSKTRAIE